jgi:hypothetical protein
MLGMLLTLIRLCADGLIPCAVAFTFMSLTLPDGLASPCWRDAHWTAAATSPNFRLLKASRPGPSKPSSGFLPLKPLRS